MIAEPEITRHESESRADDTAPGAHVGLLESHALPLDAVPAPTTLADVLVELKRIRHALGLSHALAVGEKDLARLLGISPATLARWKAAGRLLPGIRKGGRILYVLDGPSGVRAWLAAGMPDAKNWTERA
jgi:hypothetical protein